MQFIEVNQMMYFQYKLCSEIAILKVPDWQAEIEQFDQKL